MLSNIETEITPNEQELLQIPTNASTKFYEINEAIKGATRNEERAKLSNTPPLEPLSSTEPTTASTKS
jgi:hypothetical protein